VTALPLAVRQVLDRPEVTCDIDVTVRREGTGRGWVQLHSGQALRGDTVAAVSSAGGRVEVAWWGLDEWHIQLARAATVRLPEAAEPPPPPEFEVPLDVLLATGEAIRTHRPELLDELARRAGSDDPAGARDRLVRLHTAVVGRLLATVAARDGDDRRVGWVSWLLFADGWRALTPTQAGGRPTVRVDPVEPSGLGPQVARLVTVARGRP
jgi:hypothetical protein